MRTMVHSVRAAGIALLAVAAAACGSGGSSKPSAATTTAPPPSVSSSTAASSSSVPSSTTTSVPVPDVSTAVWPPAAGKTRFQDPVAAARSFAVDFVHMVDPVVGKFAAGDSRSGEVAIRGSARGPVTTVLVRRIGADGSWWVLGSGTPNIRLTEPAALGSITSPVRLRGTSTAFEATVNVSIRQDDHTGALADTFVMGGANGQMGPFDATVKFARPTSRAGAIVLVTLSSETGHVLEATVVRVRFAAA